MWRVKNVQPKWVIGAILVLLALAFLTGALKWAGGNDSSFDAEATVRRLLEKEITKQGYSAVEINDIHCVAETDRRFGCVVTSIESGEEVTAGGTLSCDGTDPGDYCIWRGELRGG